VDDLIRICIKKTDTLIRICLWILGKYRYGSEHYRRHFIFSDLQWFICGQLHSVPKLLHVHSCTLLHPAVGHSLMLLLLWKFFWHSQESDISLLISGPIRGRQLSPPRS
jgi:hypothetical protein